MPVRSIVQLRCWSLSLALAADWLSSYQWPSLFYPDGSPERRREAEQVAATLRTAAGRKRRRFMATVNLPRDQAEWLATVNGTRGLFGRQNDIPSSVAELAMQCRLKTGSSSRGRRRLDRLAVEDRVEGRRIVDERHRKRLRRRLRDEQASASIRSLFGTILKSPN